jgi:hypothetical protein
MTYFIRMAIIRTAKRSSAGSEYSTKSMGSALAMPAIDVLFCKDISSFIMRHVRSNFDVDRRSDTIKTSCEFFLQTKRSTRKKENLSDFG